MHQAILVLRCEMSGIILERGDAKECKTMIEECEKKLDELTGCENRTFAVVHNAAARYHKATNDSDAFYKSALMYLGYVNVRGQPPLRLPPLPPRSVRRTTILHSRRDSAAAAFALPPRRPVLTPCGRRRSSRCLSRSSGPSRSRSARRRCSRRKVWPETPIQYNRALPISAL